jgi:3-oxoadipate enol-lactonase
MPFLHVNGARLHYEERGAGEETVVLSHGLLWSGRMFDAQVEALSRGRRCIVYDHRGQGRSEVTAGGYDMDTLSEDAAALVLALGAAPCHFVGLSMGGFVGMRLALRRPELLRSLTLIGTSADAEPAANVPRYRLLGAVARLLSLRLVAGRVMRIMFGRTFLGDPAREGERRAWRARLLANDRTGVHRALHGVISRDGVHDALGAIDVPTLVLVGDEDAATTPDRARRIAAAIPGARLEVIRGAGHTATVEQPAQVGAALEAFLSGLG